MLIVNLTKGQYLSLPAGGAHGRKQGELAAREGVMFEFLELLRTRWAGDEVILAGDSGSHSETFFRAQRDFEPLLVEI